MGGRRFRAARVAGFNRECTDHRLVGGGGGGGRWSAPYGHWRARPSPRARCDASRRDADIAFYAERVAATRSGRRTGGGSRPYSSGAGRVTCDYRRRGNAGAARSRLGRPQGEVHVLASACSRRSFAEALPCRPRTVTRAIPACLATRRAREIELELGRYAPPRLFASLWPSASGLAVAPRLARWAS